MYTIIKKLIIVIVITVLATGIKAQPYKLFIPNVDYLYADSANYIKGFRIIKSLAESNGDSIYHPYPETNMYWDYTCYKTKEFSWISLKIISKTDGTAILFNFNNDSIIIKTQSELNDSWICYRFNNGNKILARVTAFDTLSFLGIIDSVKTISFEYYDNANNRLAYRLDNLPIQLSKNYGLVRTFNFDCFPDIVVINGYSHYCDVSSITTNLGIFRLKGFNNSIGIKNITKRAVFDFQPGDLFHIFYFHDEGMYHNIPHLDTIKTKRTILERQDYNDSICYKVHEIAQNITSNWLGYNMSYTDTIRWIIYNLYDTFNLYDTLFDALPANEVLIHYTHFAAYIYKPQLAFSYNNRLDKMIYDNFGTLYNFEGDSCYKPPFIKGRCSNYYDHYIDGLGGPYYFCTCDDGVGVSRLQLVYYKKGSETWGAPLSINEGKNIKDNPQVNIYPNPWSSTSNIIINSTSEGNVTVFNNLGKEVYSTTFNPGNEVINLNRTDYKSGMYFFLVVPKTGNPVVKKFIVE